MQRGGAGGDYPSSSYPINQLYPTPTYCNPCSVFADPAVSRNSYASAPPYSSCVSGGSGSGSAVGGFQSLYPNVSDLSPSAPALLQPVFPSFTPYSPGNPPVKQSPSPAVYYQYDAPLQTPPAAASGHTPISGGQNLSLSSYGSAVPNASSYYPSIVESNTGSSYFGSNSDQFAPVGYRSNTGSEGFEGDYLNKQPTYSSQHNISGSRTFDDGVRDGIYAYGGHRADLHGARVPTSRNSLPALFDDYGRSMSLPFSGVKEERGGSSVKIIRAIPKAEMGQGVKNSAQKFRVKLLPEGAGSTLDVLCQVGLDGIRMLDPNTARTLRIYPLDTVTRWEVLDSSIFAFWSKSTVDIEARRIRLKSNSYTTSTLLDTVTAASVQFKEISGTSITRSQSDIVKPSEQPSEKKKGLMEWMNFIKPLNEEKDHWVPDEVVRKCTGCGADFTAFNRRHHCRNCGDIFCDKCTQGRIALTLEDGAQPVRVCDRCMGEVSHRLSNAKEAANRPVGPHSHEDLAKKLQEVMDINSKASSASKSSSRHGRQTREVACPICTVHLQVQADVSGSQTIECGVCQHRFVVNEAP